MSDFSKLLNRRPVPGSSPPGRRFRAELETLEDRVTPSLTPADVSVAVIGSDTVAENTAATHFQIADADIPRLNVSLSADRVTEDGGAIVVTLKRSGNLNVDSYVSFQLNGSAQRDIDYTVTGASFYEQTSARGGGGPSPRPGEFHHGHVVLVYTTVRFGVVYFPAGSDVVTFVIHPTADSADEPDESIFLNLHASGSEYFISNTLLSATIVGNPGLPPETYQAGWGGLFDGAPFHIRPRTDIPPTVIGNPPAPLSAGQRAIESLYVNLLGRSGDSAGRTGWLSRYNAGTPMRDIVLGFQQSSEFAERFVNEKYQQILSRSPEAEGLAFWSAKIMAGESTDGVVRDILLSPESTFVLRSNTDFVAKAYRMFLGREADAFASGWIAGLDSGGSRAAFVQGVIDSREARDRRIRSAYQTYLHHGASDAELSGWNAFVIGSGATPSKFLAEFLNSVEFHTHAN